MKVALAFPGCHRRGGVERVTFECARFLAGRGHGVTVFAHECELSASPAIDHRPVALRCWPPFRRPLEFFRECSRAFDPERERFDALGSFGCVSPVGGVYWAQSVHAAWLHHSRRLRPARSLLRWKQRLNPIHRVLLRLEQTHLGERRYGKVIALTDQVRADLRRFYDVPDQDIVVLPNGFSPDEFNVDRRNRLRQPVRERLGYRPGDRVVLLVANELERKGFAPLLRALAALADPSLRLLVAGRVQPGRYAGEIANSGMADRVHFAGSSGDVMRFYAAADLLALPTQYEPWGMVIVEALASGLPVVTSELAGAAVAIKPGESGFLLGDPQNAAEIAHVVRQGLSAITASAEAISQSVQAYRWDHLLMDYERILADCAANA